MPPVAAAVGSIAAGLIGSITVGTVATFAAKVAVTVGLTYALKALAPQQATVNEGSKEKSFGAGFKDRLQAGGVVPRSFIIGKWSTYGSLVYVNTYGDGNRTPNAFLVYVVALSDLPIEAVRELYIDGKKVGGSWTTNSTGSGRGTAIGAFTKSGKEHAWMRFHDGRQTSSDSYLVSKFSNSNREWTSDMVGRGVAYVVLTFRVNEKLFSGFPEARFVVDGIPLYDPRKDSSVGGSGSQRWDNQSSWGTTATGITAVQIYNILRGIKYNNQWVWGGQTLTAQSLPFFNWVSAMNVCDQNIPQSGGGEANRYRSGAEIQFDEQPLDVVERLLKACNGKLAECGGKYKLRVGSQSPAPIFSVLDENIMVSSSQEFDPLLGLNSQINGLSASYISSGDGWTAKAAPTRLRNDFIVEDGRKSISNVTYEYVSSRSQVERLMKSILEESRRERKHVFEGAPEFFRVEPTDYIEYNSDRNGYIDKVFDVDWVAIESNGAISMGITEIDPDDYDWTASDEITDEDYPTLDDSILGTEVIGFAAQGTSLPGDNGYTRPVLQMIWDTDDSIDDVIDLSWEVYRSGTLVKSGMVGIGSFEEGNYYIQGGTILPSTTYHVRAKYVPGSARDTEWTTFRQCNTPATKFLGGEIGDTQVDDNHLKNEAVTIIKADESPGAQIIGGSSTDANLQINHDNTQGYFIINGRVRFDEVVGNILEVTLRAVRGNGDSTDVLTERSELKQIFGVSSPALQQNREWWLTCAFEPPGGGSYTFTMKLRRINLTGTVGDITVDRKALFVTRFKKGKI